MMFRRIGKCIAVATATVLALGLAACGSSSTGETTNPDGPVEITFFSYKGEAIMGPVIEAFEAATPDVKIKATYNIGSGPEYASTLQTRIAGGQTPDVFQIVGENRADVINNGLATDLSDLTATDTVNPSFLDLYRDGEKLYGISYSAWMGGLVYNKDLLKQVGYDTVPATWDEFVKMGEALLEAGVTPYYEEQGIASGSLTALLASSFDGAGVPSVDWALDARPKGKTYAESWTPVIEAWNKAITSGVMPTDTIGLKQDAIKAAFLAGEVAMYRSGTWDGKDLDASGMNYGFAPFPGFEDGPTYINGGCEPPHAIAEKADEAHKAAAKKFLEFMGTAEAVKIYSDSQGTMSISSAYETNAGAAFQDAYKNNLLEGKKYWFEWSKAPAQLTSTIATQQQLMFQKQNTPQSFAEAVDAEFDKA